jgi:muramoyltetrapeptide carboxypeptidase LdcA involved in peptidoglycan recycling
VIESDRLLRPRALAPGDRLAAVSLSWGGPGAFPQRYEAGKWQLEEEFGVEVVAMPHALDPPDEVAAHPELRADDLHRALGDPSIAGIVSTIGGDDSIRLLPLLDLDLIRSNPKVFLGFSDATITHMAFLRAGVVSFYGPALMTAFAESGGMHHYACEGVREVLFSAGTPPAWPENDDGWTVEHLDWSNPENQTRTRMLTATSGWRWLGGDVAEGPIVAGCLEVLDWLRGTPWFPDLEGAVLAVETSEEGLPPPMVSRYFRSLAASGDLHRLAAVLFGRPGGPHVPADEHLVYDEALVSVIRDEVGLPSIPVVTGMDFGHTDPIWTLPQGVASILRIDASTSSRPAFAPDPSSTMLRAMKGRNLVTPQDLGARVSFQFELPNGYTSEVVGVFERWDEEAETYFVKKADGTEVRVPARGVRFGKVVPQPPG